MFAKSFREILKWTERFFTKGIAHIFTFHGKETCGFEFEIGFMKPYFMGFDPVVTILPYIFCYIPFSMPLFLIFLLLTFIHTIQSYFRSSFTNRRGLSSFVSSSLLNSARGTPMGCRAETRTRVCLTGFLKLFYDRWPGGTARWWGRGSW